MDTIRRPISTIYYFCMRKMILSYYFICIRSNPKPVRIGYSRAKNVQNVLLSLMDIIRRPIRIKCYFFMSVMILSYHWVCIRSIVSYHFIFIRNIVFKNKTKPVRIRASKAKTVTKVSCLT